MICGEQVNFIQIPAGCAFASVTDDLSHPLSILTADHVPAVREPTPHASLDLEGSLPDLRQTAEVQVENVLKTKAIMRFRYNCQAQGICHKKRGEDNDELGGDGGPQNYI